MSKKVYTVVNNYSSIYFLYFQQEITGSYLYFDKIDGYLLEIESVRLFLLADDASDIVDIRQVLQVLKARNSLKIRALYRRGWGVRFPTTCRLPR